MPIEISDAKQSDLEYVKQYSINEAVTKEFADTRLAGWCKTATCNGDILGVGGCVVYWPGVGEAWYTLSKHAEQHKIKIVFCLKRMADLAMEELNLHRLQCTIRVDFVQAKKLVEKVGFKCEGTMKSYTENKIDTFMYALVR